MPTPIDEILASPPVSPAAGEAIGLSREGRRLRAFRVGRGGQRISLVGGCHADEPVGPRLLRRLCGYLSTLPDTAPLLRNREWWIIPHLNPDGEERNRGWQDGAEDVFDPGRFLAGVVREEPGDDIEFGFPRTPGDPGARPENRAAFDWWSSAPGPFAVHVSLHGMGFAAGPWFLIEPAWRDRCESLKERCRAATLELGYALHDVERRGEKGFFRIEPGFCTRPDSRFMREHFRALGDEPTAAKFRPSSMETMRRLGRDALTLVSEMPLFVTPGVGVRLGPPDPVAEAWKERIATWRRRLAAGEDPSGVSAEARAAGLRPMPVRDQMILQWSLIAAGVELVEPSGALPEA